MPISTPQRAGQTRAPQASCLRAQPRKCVPTTLAAAFSFSLFAGCETKITDSDIRFVKVAEVRDLTSRQARAPDSRLVALIDPRAAATFKSGHLPGARNLKLPQVPERSSPDPELASFKHLIVYGDNPGSVAARAMTKRMMAVGYKGVRLFAGGVEEWREAGYLTQESLRPTETATPDPNPAADLPPPSSQSESSPAEAGSPPPD